MVETMKERKKRWAKQGKGYRKEKKIGKGTVTYFSKKSYEKSKKEGFKKEKKFEKEAAARRKEREDKAEATKKFKKAEAAMKVKPVKEEAKPAPITGAATGITSEAEESTFKKVMAYVKGAGYPTVDDALMALGATGIAKGTMSVGKAIAPIAKKVRDRSVSRLSLKTGKSITQINKMIKTATAKQGVDDIVKGLSAKKLAKMAFKWGVALAGTDVIISWYALDNIITGQKFFVKDILSAVKSGSISPADARDNVAKSIEIREAAITKVEAGTKINPMLWAFRNLILTGVEADQLAISLIVDEINIAASEAEVSGLTAKEAERKEEEEYYAGIAEKKKSAKMAERKEEEEYYAGIEEKRKTAKAEERKADEAYWKKVREKK